MKKFLRIFVDVHSLWFDDLMSFMLSLEAAGYMTLFKAKIECCLIISRRLDFNFFIKLGSMRLLFLPFLRINDRSIKVELRIKVR